MARLGLGLMALVMISTLVSDGVAFAEGDSLAQLRDPVKVQIDRHSGCWFNRQGDYAFEITLKRPMSLFVRMADPVGARNVDEAPWGGRVPILYYKDAPQGDTGIEMSEYDRDYAYASLTKPGPYILTFLPNAMHGADVEVTICVRVKPTL